MPAAAAVGLPPFCELVAARTDQLVPKPVDSMLAVAVFRRFTFEDRVTTTANVGVSGFVLVVSARFVERSRVASRTQSACWSTEEVSTDLALTQSTLDTYM
jgi:hypothetical protein